MASSIGYLRDVFAVFCCEFGLCLSCLKSLKLVELGVHFSFDGMPLRVQISTLRGRPDPGNGTSLTQRLAAVHALRPVPRLHDPHEELLSINDALRVDTKWKLAELYSG